MPDLGADALHPRADLLLSPLLGRHPFGHVGAGHQVDERPVDFGIGRDRVAAYSDRLLVETARGRVLVQRPGAFEARFPGMTPPDAPATPYFAGYVIGVEDLNKTAKLLKKNGVGAVKVGRMLQVPPQQAFGCMIAFQEPTEA